MRDKLEYYVLSFFIKIAKILPDFFILFIVKSFAVFIYLALKPRRELTIDNLKRAYPHKSIKEIKQIAIKSFVSVAITAYESILILNDKLDMDKMVVNGQEAMEIFNNTKKPIVFVTAHFGNWELLAHYVAYKGLKIGVVGRKGDNRLIEKDITKKFRTKFGNSLIYKDEAMFKIVKYLRQGQSVGILIDQKPGSINSIKCNFFGIKCNTSKTIATLKIKYNPEILGAFLIRLKDGKYKILIKNFEYNLTNKKDEDIFNITQGINDMFEEVINQSPEQWFWMHNRWKI